MERAPVLFWRGKDTFLPPGERAKAAHFIPCLENGRILTE